MEIPPDSPAKEDHPFRPLLIERERSFRIEGHREQVFFLFGPEERPLWWQPSRDHAPLERLFPGSTSSLSGAMYYAPDAYHGMRWNVMAEHNAEAGFIRWILFLPEIECLIEEIRCEEISPGETQVTITWRVAGLSEVGNGAVHRFFAAGLFEKQITMLQSQLQAYLRDSRDLTG